MAKYGGADVPGRVAGSWNAASEQGDEQAGAERCETGLIMILPRFGGRLCFQARDG